MTGLGVVAVFVCLKCVCGLVAHWESTVAQKAGTPKSCMARPPSEGRFSSPPPASASGLQHASLPSPLHSCSAIRITTAGSHTAATPTLFDCHLPILTDTAACPTHPYITSSPHMRVKPAACCRLTPACICLPFASFLLFPSLQPPAEASWSGAPAASTSNSLISSLHSHLQLLGLAWPAYDVSVGRNRRLDLRVAEVNDIIPLEDVDLLDACHASATERTHAEQELV
eukprot:331392-Chlamydomonas_euryale.AAC.8